MEWLYSLLTGAAGGNLAGALLKKFNLGLLGNTIVGILGGAAGKGILGSLGLMADNPMVADVAGGAAGGGVLMVIVGFVKNLLAKK